MTNIYAGGETELLKAIYCYSIFTDTKKDFVGLQHGEENQREAEVMLLPLIISQAQPTRVVKVLGLLGLE